MKACGTVVWVAGVVALAAGVACAAEPGVGSSAPAAQADGSGVERKADLLSQTIDVERIKHERALTLYNIAMERANKALEDGEWDQAILRANDALAVLDENRDALWGTELVELRSKANKTMEAGKGKSRIAAAGIAGAAGAASDEEIRRQVAATERRKRVQALQEDAKTYVQQHKLIEAMDTYRQLLLIDPTNAEAKTALRLLSDTANFRTFEKLAEQQSAEQTQQGLESKERLIPYSDLVTYPDDWVEKTRGRE